MYVCISICMYVYVCLQTVQHKQFEKAIELYMMAKRWESSYDCDHCNVIVVVVVVLVVLGSSGSSSSSSSGGIR
jgi:hypothetical protein